MQTKQWADMNKTMANSMMKFAEINTNLATSLLRQQVEVVGICAETGIKHMQAMGEAKRLQDMFVAQSENLQEFNRKMAGNFRETFEMMLNTKTDFTAWYENGFKQAATLNPLSKTA